MSVHGNRRLAGVRGVVDAPIELLQGNPAIALVAWTLTIEHEASGLVLARMEP